LELDLTDSHVLTTYAGLLLRDLLDGFNGDVEKAVGAYNGGPGNPNLRYAAGVQAVAEYARNVLERVTAVNERAAADTLERELETSSQ
jgi:soluble lytic murein transglycosylase-like protein